MSTDIAAGWCCVVGETPPNTQHQPAETSVDNTRSCSCNDMLLPGSLVTVPAELTDADIAKASEEGV